MLASALKQVQFKLFSSHTSCFICFWVGASVSGVGTGLFESFDLGGSDTQRGCRRKLVYLVICDSGEVSLEHLLLSLVPLPEEFVISF